MSLSLNKKFSAKLFHDILELNKLHNKLFR